MRRLVLFAGLLTSTYLLVWGVTWILGDRSMAITVVTDSGSITSYPRVFLGGLPPTPEGLVNTPFFAAAAGFAGVIASGLFLLRDRPKHHGERQ